MYLPWYSGSIRYRGATDEGKGNSGRMCPGTEAVSTVGLSTEAREASISASN